MKPLVSDLHTGASGQKLVSRKGSLVSRSSGNSWQRPGVAVPTKLLGGCASDCPMHQSDADAARCATQSCHAARPETESTQQGCACRAQDATSLDMKLLPENRPATDSHSSVVVVLPPPKSDAATHIGLARRDSSERVRSVLVLATSGPRAPPTA